MLTHPTCDDHSLLPPAVCLAGYETLKPNQCKACGPNAWSRGGGARCQRCSCPVGPCQASAFCSPTTGQCRYINKPDSTSCGPNAKCNGGVCKPDGFD
jgi:hypothetical protein